MPRAAESIFPGKQDGVQITGQLVAQNDPSTSFSSWDSQPEAHWNESHPRQPTVLVIENEVSVGELLMSNLQKEGFQTEWEINEVRGLMRAQLMIPDVCILNLMLPGMGGVEICRQLRAGARTANTSIIVLSAQREESYELSCFAVGADDYVTRPVRIQPLIQRVRAILQRVRTIELPLNNLCLHDLELDRTQQLAFFQGTELKLTPSEFRMLWALMSQAGRAFSRRQLMSISCIPDSDADVRTIDVRVLSLRRKLRPHQSLIQTVQGIGYRFLKE